VNSLLDAFYYAAVKHGERSAADATPERADSAGIG